MIRHIDAILASLTAKPPIFGHSYSYGPLPGCRKLQAATGLLLLDGPHGAGKQNKALQEEGGDMDFVPDQAVRHGDIIEGGNCRRMVLPLGTRPTICVLRCVRKKLYLLVTMLWGGRQVSFPLQMATWLTI